MKTYSFAFSPQNSTALQSFIFKITSNPFPTPYSVYPAHVTKCKLYSLKQAPGFKLTEN